MMSLAKNTKITIIAIAKLPKRIIFSSSENTITHVVLNTAKEDSEEEMVKLNKAYEVLSDEGSRKKYDRYLKVD